jgi:hypothetical protein
MCPYINSLTRDLQFSEFMSLVYGHLALAIGRSAEKQKAETNPAYVWAATRIRSLDPIFRALEDTDRGLEQRSVEGTALQVGRSRDRFPVSLGFFRGI